MKQIEINIPELIRKARMRKGWTQKKLSQLMGVRPSVVSKWETNRQIPNGYELIKLAKLLDIVSDLFPNYEKINESFKLSPAKIQKEIDKIWQTIQRKEQEETDLKQIIILLLKDKITAKESKIPEKVGT